MAIGVFAVSCGCSDYRISGEETMKTKRVILYCLAGLVAGCGPILSLNPLFTKDSLVFDEGLLGTWIGDSNDMKISLEFTRVEEDSLGDVPKELQGESKRAYRLNLYEEGKRKGVLLACLVKLGDRRFLDIFPDQYPSGESDEDQMKLGFNASFFLRSHMLARVDAIGEKLDMHVMDDEGFTKLVEAEPKAVAYATTEDGPVLTASPKELQTFVTKYAADERLFALDAAFVRKSK